MRTKIKTLILLLIGALALNACCSTPYQTSRRGYTTYENGVYVHHMPRKPLNVKQEWNDLWGDTADYTVAAGIAYLFSL